jgi:S-DNA-T family DNA segregation ATPase FtsK/SpoIIIE
VGWGTLLILIFSLIVFIIYFFNITHLLGFGKHTDEDGNPNQAKAKGEPSEDLLTDEEKEWKRVHEIEKEGQETQLKKETDLEVPEKNVVEEKESITLEMDDAIVPAPAIDKTTDSLAEEGPEFTVDEEKVVEKVGDSVENYDPTLDLSEYQYPSLDLLNKYDEADIQVTKEELEENKDKIIETLINFKIGISSIKATIGPTVTLYEIVPEAGIKISKIKNLEDDIALSLAALGIRIIAPIPGKGTIGIEVPNKKRELVAVRSVLSTEKFLKSEMELPIILGKTISNEVFLTDLTKMPHLLMAGATGQGKSVGINVILSSLLYKKHPSQLKLILVDPKKVELSLFNKIERHFLAELPGSEEPIITDHKQVVHTLNSLCIEMDNRYNLLKEAGTRNLKEYNRKFVQRRLNPEKGHKYLPYIVLVVDELADLMMTSGKEVEGPIARLAQLARAIGIHLVVATQRPSVNVITGIIKANFPTRMSFRVTSTVDSRTILDSGGAERLVGMGDMLLSQGSDIIRLQCPFVDTEEIEKICDFIGEQRGYESAYLLPEYIDESGEGNKTVDLDDRDVLFEEAAKLIVLHQQGSTSLIQRKMKLGYNRAGRLIDQLEAAGIVGPFEGSKARDVLVQDPYALEQRLNELNEENE